jgi:uncharacterized protein (TIGR04255 family)
LGLAPRPFTDEELSEVFPRPPLREVAFEVRFTTRLRIQAETWKLQERLLKKYPEVGKANNVQPNGSIVDVSVFHNTSDSRVIKITDQNFLIAFTRYTNFEDFRHEVITRTDEFCSVFGVDSFVRVGLRYVNEIVLPTIDPSALMTYVNPIMNFARFPANLVEQFAAELVSHYKDHYVTVRSALLPGQLRTYVLDIDCHSTSQRTSDEYKLLLDDFHDSAQRIFLDHVTDEYKELMRVKR